MSFEQYTNKTPQEVLDDLKASPNGISKKESSLRQKTFGLNEIKASNVNIFEIIWRQLKSPFSYLLLAAAIISVLVGEKSDSIAILVFILINIVIGFFQEYRAERAVASLKKFLPYKVKVFREGKIEITERSQLVPGDIVFLEAGDIVPADLKVLEVTNFLVDESALTGESSLVSKISEKLSHQEKEIFKAQNIIFSGTLAAGGKAKGVVIATSKETVFGQIVKTVSSIKRQSTYEKSIYYFCRLILKIVLVTIAIIFAVNIAIKGIHDFFSLLLFSVALIVSILPEALPAVVTFSLADGSLKMAKKHVVVKRLSAIEDLGNLEVLCTDKTGTLTQNKLSLEKIVSSDKNKCFLYGLMASGSPFDSAILKRAPDEIINKLKKFKTVSELPFDSFRMMSSILSQSSTGEKFLIVKGAPEFVVKNCSSFTGNFDKKELKEDMEKEGREGKRVLAVAFKKITKGVKSLELKDEKGLTFLGYFVFEDPLKTTSKEAIELAKKLGVQIKIITGDSKEVALFASQKMGMALTSKDLISGEQLDLLTKDDFDDACREKIIFARISPNVKHKIIKSLQKNYEVGFMGEGVNDAPALKTADVGIAVAEASDVARESADVVLLQKDLRVIINGIKDGRTIFANINKYIKCALASNFGNFYSIAAISLFINYLPMLPVQILLGNILSDFPMIAIATDSVDIDELRRPKLYELSNVLPLIISLALVSTLFDFIFFYVFYRQSPSNIQTLWFIESMLTEIFLIFIIRTRGVFWKAKRPGLLLSALTIIDGILIITLPFLQIGHSLFHFINPPIIPLLVVFFLTLVYFAVSEFVKLIYFRYKA